MPRQTIADLRAEFEKHDQASAREIEKLHQEIGRLTSALDEAHRRNAERAQSFRLIKTIVEDAQK